MHAAIKKINLKFKNLKTINIIPINNNFFFENVVCYDFKIQTEIKFFKKLNFSKKISVNLLKNRPVY